VSIWGAILAFVKFWVVLFTGKIPQSIYEFELKLNNWGTRLGAVLGNLVDGYPAFGLKGTSDKATLEFENPQKVSRGLVLLRALLGVIYAGIPHGFCLFFRMIWGAVLQFLAWWAVLFTGKYPEKWHAYQVGTSRWTTRLGLYLGYYTDQYPPFSGKE